MDILKPVLPSISSNISTSVLFSSILTSICCIDRNEVDLLLVVAVAIVVGVAAIGLMYSLGL